MLWRTWWQDNWLLLLLFTLFIAVNAVYLDRVPGLMGDEGSEGENVYQLWDKKELPVRGERSYIGPSTDLLRVPLVLLFGYTTIALRLLMLLAAALSFWLAASSFRRLLGQPAALLMTPMIFFSPMYLTMGRMGWAITLLPFFALLMMWLITRRWPQRPLVVGMVAGLGLHTHILFLPTIAGFIAVGAAALLLRMWQTRRSLSRLLHHVRMAISWWPVVIGATAAFGTQMAMLLLDTSDQGDPSAVAAVVGDRLVSLVELLPNIVSGSSYIAWYTGVELSLPTQWSITATVLGLLGLAIVRRRSWPTQLLAVGLAVHIIVLLYMIDRFSLRYWYVATLGIWCLAGYGLARLLTGLADRLRLPRVVPIGSIAVSLILTCFFLVHVMVPFLLTGGSVARFGIGTYSDSASALVDTRPLITCLRGVGAVSSTNVHIYNRLQYVSHHYSDITFITEEQLSEAELLVHYRDGSVSVAPHQEVCPELTHFIVVKK